MVTVTGRISTSYVIVPRILPSETTQREGTPHNRKSHLLEHQTHDIGQISLFISEHELEGQSSKMGMLSSSRCLRSYRHFYYHNAWLVLPTFRAWGLVTLLALKYTEPYYAISICPIYPKALESFSKL